MSSRSLNKVALIGNLTRDPELRYTPQGTPVCTFGLATNRSWQPSAGGERQEETEFHRVVSWNKLAELCNELLFKGRKAYVEGRLQTRNWTDAQGQERTTVEVVIDNMIVLDSKRRDGSTGGSYQQDNYGDQATGDNQPGDDAVAEPPIDDVPAPAEKTTPAGEENDSKKAKKVVEPKVEEKTGDEKVNPDDIPF